MTFARRQHPKSLQIQALPRLKRAWEICTGRYFFEKNSAELHWTPLHHPLLRLMDCPVPPPSTLAKACFYRTSG